MRPRAREREKERERQRGWAAACHSCIRQIGATVEFLFVLVTHTCSTAQSSTRETRAGVRCPARAACWYVRTTDDASGRSLTCGGRRVSQRQRRHGQRALPSGYLRQVVTRLIGNSLCGGGPEMIGCRCVIHRARRKRASGRLTDPKVSDRKSSLARQWMICDGTGHSTRDHGEHWAPPSCVQRAFLRRAGSGRRQALAAAATGGCVSKVETDSG